YGRGGALTSLVASCFSFENPESGLLAGWLPPLIRLQADGSPTAQWLQATLQLMDSEADVGHAGWRAVVSRMGGPVFVQALRSQIASMGMEDGSGWIGALKDPQIGAALRLIHQHPEREWTVQGLAAEVSMSRSAFASRFRTLVEDTPLGYLTRWRMLRA